MPDATAELLDPAGTVTRSLVHDAAGPGTLPRMLMPALRASCARGSDPTAGRALLSLLGLWRPFIRSFGVELLALMIDTRRVGRCGEVFPRGATSQKLTGP